MKSDLGSRLVGGIFLAIGGWSIGYLLEAPQTVLGIGLVVGGALLGLIATPYVVLPPLRLLWRFLTDVPLATLIPVVFGLVLGLVVGALLSIPIGLLPAPYGSNIPLVVTAAFGIFGIALGIAKSKDIRMLIPLRRKSADIAQSSQEQPILLDTSAIIDGRIADISQTGFLRGTLTIPRFVLDELRHIADSGDALRRNRGRRGLEMLNRLRKETNVKLDILDVDMRNGMEVDGKLIVLAKRLQAPIVTTDFNLNRVAELQGIKALNVNELANTLKPVVIPGEEMLVRVIQEGKEARQGVAFLDDGTMIVVEDGKQHINKYLDVNITRVLQTAAGRIIFAQPKDGTRNGK